GLRYGAEPSRLVLGLGAATALSGNAARASSRKIVTGSARTCSVGVVRARGERAVIAALVPDDCLSQGKRARDRASSLRDSRASLLRPWPFCSAVPLPLSR